MTRKLTEKDLEGYWVREEQLKRFLKEYKKEIEELKEEKIWLIKHFERLLETKRVKVGKETYVIFTRNDFDTFLKELSWLDRKKHNLIL